MDNRRLIDLVSIGPKMLEDLHALGIRTVGELAAADADDMYVRMCGLTATRQDPCVLDTYRAAVAQARDPDLPSEQRQWWYWSRLRKAGRIGDADGLLAADRAGKPAENDE